MTNADHPSADGYDGDTMPAMEMDNHHNAGNCPHCTENGRFVLVAVEELVRLRASAAAYVETVARGLTKAQRETLLSFPGDPEKCKWSHERKHFVHYPSLKRSRLAIKLWTSSQDNPWSITPLGLAVRQYLMEQPK